MSNYRPKTKFANVMFLHVSVILSTGGGGSASVHAWIPIPLGPGSPPGGRPPDQAPSGSRTPWDQAPPSVSRPLGPGTPHAQCMLGDTVNKRAVCILLKCNLVCFVFFYSHGLSSNGTNDFCVWQKLMTPYPLVKISTEFELSNICELHQQCPVVSVSDITGY